MSVNQLPACSGIDEKIISLSGLKVATAISIVMSYFGVLADYMTAQALADFVERR